METLVPWNRLLCWFGMDEEEVVPFRWVLPLFEGRMWGSSPSSNHETKSLRICGLSGLHLEDLGQWSAMRNAEEPKLEDRGVAWRNTAISPPFGLPHLTKSLLGDKSHKSSKIQVILEKKTLVVSHQSDCK